MEQVSSSRKSTSLFNLQVMQKIYFLPTNNHMSMNMTPSHLYHPRQYTLRAKRLPGTISSVLPPGDASNGKLLVLEEIGGPVDEVLLGGGQICARCSSKLLEILTRADLKGGARKSRFPKTLKTVKQYNSNS